MILRVVDIFPIVNSKEEKCSFKEGVLFRKQYLLPFLWAAAREKEKITIDLDDSFGYNKYFLIGAFDSLRSDVSKRIIKRIVIKSEDQPGLVEKIKNMMRGLE